MTTITYKKYIPIVLLVFLVITSFLILKPLLLSILLGALFAFISYPLYKIVKRKREILPALFVCIFVLAILVVPTGFFIKFLVKESFALFLLVKQKLAVGSDKMLDNANVNFIDQGKLNNNYDDQIAKLPYIFKDPIKLDKKIDPKKLQFGSRIDENTQPRDDFFTVKEIINPETLKLNNDLIVKLLGIKNNPEKTSEAINYLRNKTNKQRVFLRFDNVKYDKENNLLCYVYLQNKTFINAHLIKEGCVFVNNEMDYKYKEKFINLSQNYAK